MPRPANRWAAAHYLVENMPLSFTKEAKHERLEIICESPPSSIGRLEIALTSGWQNIVSDERGGQKAIAELGG